jgi:hypothetical protein
MSSVAPIKPIEDEDTRREWLLVNLRHGRMRARLLVNEITFIGIAVKSGLLSTDDAIVMMSEAGADFLYPEINDQQKGNTK